MPLKNHTILGLASTSEFGLHILYAEIEYLEIASTLLIQILKTISNFLIVYKITITVNNNVNKFLIIQNPDG